MGVKYLQSFRKNISQLGVVASSPFSFEGEVFNPPELLKLSPTFWRKYGCFLQCGGCCPHFSLDYIPAEFDDLKNQRVKEGAQPLTLTVNDKPKVIHSYLSSEPRIAYEKEWCDFLDLQSGACTIHEENPLSCQTELIKFKRVKERGYIGKQHFGRKWQMIRAIDGGELICTMEDFDANQFWNNDVKVLERMLNWATHLGIDTHLETILQAVKFCVNKGDLRTFTIRNDS